MCDLAPVSSAPLAPHSSSVILVSHSAPSSRANSAGSLSPPIFARAPVDGEFRNWVDSYAEGSWPADAPFPPPPAISAVLDSNAVNLSPPALSPGAEQEDTFDIHVGSSTATESASSGSSGSFGTRADELLAFFEREGYWPGPQGKHEATRLRTMARYGLGDPRRKESIQRICRLGKQFFKTSTLIITLIFEHHSVIAAEVDFDPKGDPSLDTPVRESPLSTSLCAHAITRLDKESTFIVPNIADDWRFKNNPQAIANGGALAFYASANIHLPAVPVDDQADPDLPTTLPVGSLCIISDTPRSAESVTAAERQILHDLADMVAREFALGYEQSRRKTEKTQMAFLDSFLDLTLVKPLDAPATSSAPSTIAVAQDQMGTDDPVSANLASAFKVATSSCLNLCKASSAAIFDLRTFRSAPTQRAKMNFARRRSTLTGDAEDAESQQRADAFGKGSGTIYLLGGTGDVDWMAITARQRELGDAVCASLDAFKAHGLTRYDESTPPCPMALLIIADTFAHVVAPIFDVDGTPQLLLVLTSSERHGAFEKSDSKFVNSTGSILMSALLRERALVSDQAKLAFVSQISHEVRTPVYGIASQLSLIREFSPPNQLHKLAPMLDVADVCVDALRDCLDDCLDYAKLSDPKAGDTSAEQIDAQRRQYKRCDLAKLAEDIAKATWLRKKRADLVSADLASPGARGGVDIDPVEKGKIDLILKIEQREEGANWSSWVDVGGMKRVLLNLLTNALKFTSTGSVTLTLSHTPATAEGEPVIVTIDVEDTGCGMSEAFLRGGKLFTPFVQENPFANGAGLGMSICDTIVRRMSGTLDVASTVGKGTLVRITLPLDFSGTSSPPSPSTAPRQLDTPTATSPSTFTRRVLSDELSALFTPGQKLGATPVEERPSYGFSEAVDRAHDALGTKPRVHRIPSMRQKRPGTAGMTADLVVDAAKLSLTANAAPPSPVVQQKEEKQKVSVLFADDNAIARNILAKLLGSKGVSYVSAADGEEAVEAFKKGTKFDLLLLDVQMPRKDGIAAAFDIRAHEREMKLTPCRIVALSGLSNEVDMQKSGVLTGDGPVDEWIVKGSNSLARVKEQIDLVRQELEGSGTP